MTETHEFVYNVMIFVSIFLFVIFDERKYECYNDADCNKLYPDPPTGKIMRCFGGYCKSLFSWEGAL
ncbi:unnamed protein product [Trifolium pratense]|uniref:Uncharacterized protein n=1 Tax=Trifolium pratense TaxID=57577 RepID=A0ACB0LM12_TRIPR|nr:unnamed protein product [Trifolium pratense]